MSKVADVKRLLDACTEKFGRLDILVNNAGVMFTKPVVEVGEEEFDRLFAVNVKGAFFCSQEAARRMAEGGSLPLTGEIPLYTGDHEQLPPIERTLPRRLLGAPAFPLGVTH